MINVQHHNYYDTSIIVLCYICESTYHAACIELTHLNNYYSNTVEKDYSNNMHSTAKKHTFYTRTERDVSVTHSSLNF